MEREICPTCGAEVERWSRWGLNRVDPCDLVESCCFCHGKGQVLDREEPGGITTMRYYKQCGHCKGKGVVRKVGR